MKIPQVSASGKGAMSTAKNAAARAAPLEQGVVLCSQFIRHGHHIGGPLHVRYVSEVR